MNFKEGDVLRCKKDNPEYELKEGCKYTVVYNDGSSLVLRYPDRIKGNIDLNDLEDIDNYLIKL